MILVIVWFEFVSSYVVVCSCICFVKVCGFLLVFVLNSCLSCCVDRLSLYVSFLSGSVCLMCCFIRRIVCLIFGCVVGLRFGGCGCGVLFFCILLMSRMCSVFCMVV